MGHKNIVDSITIQKWLSRPISLLFFCSSVENTEWHRNVASCYERVSFVTAWRPDADRLGHDSDDPSINMHQCEGPKSHKSYFPVLIF